MIPARVRTLVQLSSNLKGSDSAGERETTFTHRVRPNTPWDPKSKVLKPKQ